jgi:hypothetical protein
MHASSRPTSGTSNREEGWSALPYPVPNRVEAKSQAPREELLPLLVIGMVTNGVSRLQTM